MKIYLFVFCSLFQSIAFANYPCSQSAGGVAYCSGRNFICNDGRVSRSKKNCSAIYGNKSKKKGR